MDLGVGEWEFVTQSDIQRQTRRCFVRVLDVAVQRIASDTAGKIAAALEKENGLAEQKARKRIRHNRKRRKNKETVGRNALQDIDLQMLVTSAELDFVAAVHPTERGGIVKRILVRVARPRNRISDGGIPVHLNERRTYGSIQARLIAKTKAFGSRVVDSFAVEEFIPQVREAEDADHGGREGVRFLGDKILSPLILSDWKTRHARTRCGNRVKLSAITVGVAEVQDIGCSQVLIETQSELVRVLVNNLGRGVNIGSVVGRRKIAQQILRKRAEERHVKLVIGIGLVQENIEQLVVRVVAESAGKALRANLLEVTQPLVGRWDR